MLKIKRALISVSDKTGLEELAKGLDRFGVEILSTGGTARKIAGLGIKVKDVSGLIMAEAASPTVQNPMPMVAMIDGG